METDKDLAPLASDNIHTIKVMGVMGAIAYAFSNPVGVVVALSLAIVNLFLPDVLDAFRQVSSKIGSNIFAAIDNAILQHAIARADSQLRSFTDQFSNIAKLFEQWKNENLTDSVRNNAKTQLKQLYPSFVNNMLAELKGEFVHAQYGGFMLPQFVGATAQYLAVFKSFYQYAEELDLPATAATVDVQTLVLKKWREHLGDIVNTAMSSYRLGLQNIIKGTAGYARSWDDFNNFRNTTTMLALDTLTTFQYLDPELYPRGCHLRNLNRTLLSFLDTSADENFRLKYRSGIVYFEERYNRPEAVLGLKKIEMFYAKQAYDPILGPAKPMDSMVGVECTAVSQDGFACEVRFPYSGWDPKPDSTRSKTLSLDYPCYWITGRHRYPGTSNLTQSAIVLISYYLKLETRSAQRVFDLSTTALLDHQVRTFSQTLPETASTEPQWEDVKENRHHRLTKVLVDILKAEEQHNYVFSWRHWTVLEDLLPEKSHKNAEIASIAVEQFHAIRAADAIRSQNLEIIANPGFTGGDLVTLNTSQSLRWYLARDPNRWFAGSYLVRLWYIKPASEIALELTVSSEGGALRSSVEMLIRPRNDSVDIHNLRFEDLIALDSPHPVLITEKMPAVTVTLARTGLSGFIIIDRIELVFNAFGTLTAGGPPD